MASEVKANIDELQFLLSQSKRDVIRTLLQTELTKQNELLKTIAPTKPKARSSGATKKISNYAWEEKGRSVKIYVTGIKEEGDIIEKDNIESHFELRSFSLVLRRVGPKNLNYTLSISNLCKDIVPDNCTVNVSKTGVTVILAKDKTSVWSTLKAVKEEPNKKDDFPKMDKDADPSSGLMNLMKHMYETGDDEMKQTIAKSMYESQQKQKSGEPGGMPDLGDMGAGLDDL